MAGEDVARPKGTPGPARGRTHLWISRRVDRPRTWPGASRRMRGAMWLCLEPGLIGKSYVWLDPLVGYVGSLG
ncbi:unnamed protein product [Prunus armeniaca]